MQSVNPRPILNASLPSQFRQIRLELAREPGHPEGESGFAYVIIAPLDADDRIDAKLHREHREACRITRFRPDQDDQHGLRWPRNVRQDSGDLSESSALWLTSRHARRV
jgi:hypothetical protein